MVSKLGVYVRYGHPKNPIDFGVATFEKPDPETNTIRVSSDIHDVSAELYTLICWIMVGPAEKLETENRSKIPGWAGYNSLLSESRLLTKVGALPLLPEVAHEWSTLLTVLMQASQ